MEFKRFAQILQEQIDYVVSAGANLTDFNVGSATRTFFEAVAFVLAELHWIDQELVRRFFVTTAPGEWLDKRAAEFGISRILASPTYRVLTISHGSGTPAVVIPVGQQFRTLPGAAVQVTYQVIAQTTLAAGSHSVDVPVVSTSVGAATAIPDGTTLQQVGTALAFIATVVTSSISVAGVDTETDDALRVRVLERMQHPIGPGSASDLIEWAKEAPGGHVASAAVVALPRGAGSADVLVLGASNAIPSGGEIAAVQAYLDDRVAVGADVQARAPTTKVIDVQVAVTKGPGFDAVAVKAAVEGAITAYLNSRAIAETDKLAAVGDAVWRSPGVGGPTGTDGGNYSGLQQRVSPASYAAADITAGASEKIVAGTIVATVT